MDAPGSCQEPSCFLYFCAATFSNLLGQKIAVGFPDMFSSFPEGGKKTPKSKGPSSEVLLNFFLFSSATYEGERLGNVFF